MAYCVVTPLQGDETGQHCWSWIPESLQCTLGWFQFNNLNYVLWSRAWLTPGMDAVAQRLSSRDTNLSRKPWSSSQGCQGHAFYFENPNAIPNTNAVTQFVPDLGAIAWVDSNRSNELSLASGHLLTSTKNKAREENLSFTITSTRKGWNEKYRRVSHRHPSISGIWHLLTHTFSAYQPCSQYCVYSIHSLPGTLCRYQVTELPSPELPL